MKLQPKDLMIGDWVRRKYSRLILKVCAIEPPYIRAEDEGGQFHEDGIMPIPLTVEIMEKNGWEHCYDMWYSDEGVQLMTGYDGKNRLWWYISDNPVVPINFVHELQHIFRIKGIEKEIEL